MSGLGRQVDVDADVFSSSFQTCMSPIDRHRLVSDVVHGRCTSLALVGTNSCGDGDGNSFGTVHDNSCGMLTQVARTRTGIHVWNVVMTAVGNEAVEYEYSVSGVASCCDGACSCAAGVRKIA